MAEIAGFEPARAFYFPDGLANRCFKPLSHISENKKPAFWAGSETFDLIRGQICVSVTAHSIAFELDELDWLDCCWDD